MDWRTARRAWEVGWPGFKAVRDQLADEKVLARAELSKLSLAAKAAAAPSIAQEDAAQAAAREALLARIARELSLSFLAELQPLRGYVKALAERVNKPEQVAQLGTTDALEAMRTAAGTIRQIIELAAKAQQMEHLRVGDPTAIVGIKPMSGPTISLEDAEAEVAAARRALERIKAQPAAEEVADGPAHT